MKKNMITDILKQAGASKDLQDIGKSIEDVLGEVQDAVQSVVNNPFDSKYQKPQGPREFKQSTPKSPPPPPPRPQPQPSSDSQPRSDSEFKPRPDSDFKPPSRPQPRPFQHATPPPRYQSAPPKPLKAKVVNTPSANSTATALTLRKPAKGNGTGITFTALGSVFIPLSSVALILSLIFFFVNSGDPVWRILATIGLPILTTSIIFSSVGAKLRARYNRCKKYLRLSGNASFVPLQQLAESTNNSKDFVIKDLKKMLQKNMIPNAHIDAQNTCLMLDTDTYEQYLTTQKAMEERRQKEDEERRLREGDPAAAELHRIIAEGEEYLKQIKAANDAIPAEDISEELDKLTNIVEHIFDCVKRHPNKLPEIGRFMRYYLPTTLKLVTAYREFELQPVQGDNIRAAKGEIRSTLITVNKAFENLLDSLYEDDAIDISTDISVLHTMLAQEGLTGSDFEKKPDDKITLE